MDLKAFILSTVESEKYYQSRFREWDPRSRDNVTCPHHEDIHPSLSVGLANGAAKCWAASCGRSWGNIVHFEADLKGTTESDAARILYSEFVRSLVPEAEIAILQNNLRDSPSYRNWLLSDCAITNEGIKLFGLGLDRRSGRIAIPVRDRWDNCVNARLYKLPRHRKGSDEKLKVINWQKGFGKLDLFPWLQFLRYDISKPVFVMASEKETMVAILHGLQAICGTCGEDAWDDEWTELLTGYRIGIVGQNDAGGRKAAQKKLATLQTVSDGCFDIRIPSKQKDFADWVVREGGNGLALLGQLKLGEKETVQVSKSQPRVPVGELKEPVKPTYYSEELQEIAYVGTRTEMLNKVLRSNGIVAAKAAYTYSIPWKFKLKAKNSPQRMWAVPLGRELLNFVQRSDSDIVEAVRTFWKDDKLQVEPTEFITVTEVEIIPTATVDRDVPYVVQKCYYVGPWIDANIPYELEIIPTTEIRSQKTVGIIVKATPISLSFEKQTYTAEDFATLQIFQPDDGQTIWEMLFDTAEQTAKHYTKIYNRPDWHIAALLTWLSPIGWKFPNEPDIQRGWLNTLAIGDTETGKSKVVRTIQQLTKCGQIVNAENCTYVGLVGGAVKMGSNQFMLRWGRIPLCDKQLVVIEELSGLTIEQISNMSDVRSSGVARLDKGGLSAETNARTRILVLSNVRSVNKTLASYTSGVRAVQELIGHGEDIARFDLILTLVDSDVSMDVINRPARREKGKRDYEPEHLAKLVRFVWSLKPEQVRITTEAYMSCLESTKELAEEYHPAVPLFKGGSGRYKIARIAASIAALQFSWDIEKGVLIVNEEHVSAAVRFMKLLYNKPPLRYDEWSKQLFDREEVKDEQECEEGLIRILPSKKKRSKALEALVHSAKFSRDELCAVASIPFIHADDLLGIFLRNRILRKGEQNLWEITPPGKRWLEKHMHE